MHTYIIHTFQVFRLFALAFVACIYTTRTDILPASIKQEEAVHRLIHYLLPKHRSLSEFPVRCLVFVFVFVAFVFLFFLFGIIEVLSLITPRNHHHAYQIQRSTKSQNRQETREAQDRSTESNRLRAKSQETKKKGIEGGRVGWR